MIKLINLLVDLSATEKKELEEAENNLKVIAIVLTKYYLIVWVFDRLAQNNFYMKGHGKIVFNQLFLRLVLSRMGRVFFKK